MAAVSLERGTHDLETVGEISPAHRRDFVALSVSRADDAPFQMTHRFQADVVGAVTLASLEKTGATAKCQ